jgi:hypothetical protein
LLAFCVGFAGHAVTLIGDEDTFDQTALGHSHCERRQSHRELKLADQLSRAASRRRDDVDVAEIEERFGARLPDERRWAASSVSSNWSLA